MSGPRTVSKLSKAPMPDILKSTCKANTALSALIDAYRRDHPAGSLLKLEGDEASAVFLMLSGWLLTSKTLADGHRQIIDVVLPGGMLQPMAADLTTSAMDVETLTDCSIALIPQREWRAVCDTHPELADFHQKATAAASARVSEHVLRLGKAPAESIIGFVLCELCLRSSAQGLIEGKEFHIPMTQQQLGDFCGLSAVHVCRTLRRLERNGVLSVTAHMDIVIHDLDAIASIADIDIEVLQNEIIAAA